MLKFLKFTVIGLVLLITLVIGGLYATGNGPLLRIMWAFAFGGPDQAFDAADTPPAPDYADPKNWAALPNRTDLADYIPVGVTPAYTQGSAPVDVFFVHPTGFVSDAGWVFDMNANTSTEDNTGWMMANQASAYNGCCNVYAPRYRQANLFAYFRGDDVRDEVLAFAYQDVLQAFRYFVEHYSQGRPFVLASHSQGTHHSARLLSEEIDGSPLAERLVAAYIIGGGIAADTFDNTSLEWCTTPTDLGCIIHWDTYSDAAVESPPGMNIGNACTNPLDWSYGGGLVTADAHAGAVSPAGDFQIGGDSDAYTPMEFPELSAPQGGLVAAQCKDGTLFVSDQSESEFGGPGAGFGGGNYHLMDYPLFHMDIRDNAELRVATYLNANQ